MHVSLKYHLFRTNVELCRTFSGSVDACLSLLLKNFGSLQKYLNLAAREL